MCIELLWFALGIVPFKVQRQLLTDCHSKALWHLFGSKALLEKCVLNGDDASHVQDCLRALATEGQSTAGFIEDLIFQSFRVDPMSRDAKERLVRVYCHLRLPAYSLRIMVCDQVLNEPAPSFGPQTGWL